MAVETEQNTFVTPPEGGDNSPASVAVCEENLEALLKALTAPSGPAPAVVAPGWVEPPVAFNPPVVADPPTAADPPVIDPPVVVDSPIEISSPTPVSESLVHLAEMAESTAAPQHSAERNVEVITEVTAHESPAWDRSVHEGEARAKEEAQQGTARHEAAPEDAERPAESATQETSPAAESHQEVVSKLALLSSIKQRRAVAMRSDTGKSPVPEPEITGSPIGQDAALTSVEQPAPAAEKLPVPDAPPPAEKQLVKDKRFVQEDRPGAVAWKERAQPRVSEPPKIEKENPRNNAEIARDNRTSRPASQQTPKSGSITRAAGTLFPAEAEVCRQREELCNLRSWIGPDRRHGSRFGIDRLPAPGTWIETRGECGQESRDGIGCRRLARAPRLRRHRPSHRHKNLRTLQRLPRRRGKN